MEKQIETLFKNFWLWRLRNAPEFATAIGIHDYDDRLDEMSLSSYLRRIDEAKIYLQEVKSIQELSKTENLSKGSSLNLELLEADLEQYLHGSTFKPYLMPINRLEGFQFDFPRLLSYMKKDNEEDVLKIVSRLRYFPQQIRETMQLLKEGLRLGIAMHRLSIESVQLTLYLQSAEEDVEKLPMFKPFLEKPEKISTDIWEKIVEKVKTIIKVEIQPIFKSFALFIRKEYFIPKEYVVAARESIAATSLPDGENFYKACLKFHTTTDLTPMEVHELGKSEVARITKRMEQVKEEVKFEGDLKAFRQFMRTDPQFKFNSEEEILSHYVSVSKKITEVLPKFFERLPSAKFVITPIAPEAAPTMPGAYYLAPPEDASRPGTFYVNTYQPEGRLKYEAVSLCLHEAEPGHHLQSALTMETGSLVNFRRFFEDRKYYEVPGRFAMNTGYVEGWGLYSEFLGEEMGLYKDPYDLFGRFSHEMLRACRLVVDTGMHALGWSRDKAIEYMMNNTASDLQDVTSEIDRYITWPGQACGYKIGELKIKELRKKAESKLGNKFNVKRFHDVIVSMGAVPLNILEKQIDAFIAHEI